ncbi:hypothetical protein KJ854_05440 [Patescibacteria group bacterium]|nr:hypothetical protein [Patescibacteria group bacterium]
MHYQLTYIIPSDVADPKTLEGIIADINKKITDAGGIIKAPLAGLEDQMITDKSAEELEKIKKSQNVRLFKHRLGYPIKHVSYGFYVAAVYELPEKNQAAATKKITTEIKLNKKITRFINTKYNFEVFSEQSRQKEKTKNIKVPEKPEKIERKEVEPLQSIVDEAIRAKKEKKEILLDEKPAKGKKTEIEELDEKLEQILNA